MSIKFVEAKATKDKALQMALQAFGIIRYGGSITPDEAKMFIDVCSIALPMKYRFPRSTWQQIEIGVKQKLAEDDPRNDSCAETDRPMSGR